MKKFLVVFTMILAVSSIFASQEMQMELINHWESNDIEYIELEESVWITLTESQNIKLGMLKNDDSICFTFNFGITEEDYTEFVLDTEKLPYSQQFKKDLLNCLLENMRYFSTFKRSADPYYVWLDKYLVEVYFFIDESAMYLMIY